MRDGFEMLNTFHTQRVEVFRACALPFFCAASPAGTCADACDFTLRILIH